MKTLSTDELREMRKKDEHLLLINTLSTENFAAAHIPGSVNIPQQQEDFISEVEQRAGGKDKRVVVYCASDECDSSSKAAKKLENAGFSNVYDYEGGSAAWQQAGESLAAGA